MNTTHPNHFGRWVVSILAGTALLACGGGGGGGGNNPPAGSPNVTPTGTATVTSGAIEGFGSIIVNGVHYSTDDTEFEFDDDSRSSQDDLAIGMVVEIEGFIDDNGTSGKAERVRFDSEMKGPIASVAVSSSGLTKTLVILGRTIIVERDGTRFDDSDPNFTYATLGPGSVGQVVEVSGLNDAAGQLRATYIELKADDLGQYLSDPQTFLEVKGIIANLDEALETFTIGGLTIDYKNAVLKDLQNAPAGVLENGLPVEVKGRSFNGAVFAALEVEVRLPGLGHDEREHVEIEGFVSDLDPATQTFRINGQLIDYARAVFKHGTAAELAEQVKVEAEGALQNGTLVAHEISFKESIRLEANIETLDATNKTLTLKGLPGLVIQTDPDLTRYEDLTGFDDLTTGHHLKVRARLSGSILTATRIEFQAGGPEDQLILQGQVESFDPQAGTIQILGIEVDTSTIENSEFDLDEEVVGRQAFFAALAEGDTVKARARVDLTSDALTWEAVEIESED
jgi:hypothetical protein